MKIAFCGASTGGAIRPLLTLKEEIEKIEPKAQFIWIGVGADIERKMVSEKADIDYHAIQGGKWRRYFSLRNLLTPFEIFIGFVQALKILKQNKVDVIVSVGGYTAVPTIWAGWFLKIPSLIHQQDIRPTLSNTLVANRASVITLSSKSSARFFPEEKTQVTGNIVNTELDKNIDIQKARQQFHLHGDKPVVLIVGGSTGALGLNKQLENILPEILGFAQVIHVTGAGKNISAITNGDYHTYEFLSDLREAYAVADLVVCRSGFSTLTEIAYLKKVAITIPLPETHQLDNAEFFHARGAIGQFSQEQVSTDVFVDSVKEYLTNEELRKEHINALHKAMPQFGNQAIAQLVLGLKK